MKIGVLKEIEKSEKRVSISPKIAKLLIEKGFEVEIMEKRAQEIVDELSEILHST